MFLPGFIFHKIVPHLPCAPGPPAHCVSVCLPKPSLSLSQALFSHEPEGLNNVLVTKLGNVRIVANLVFFSFH